MVQEGKAIIPIRAAFVGVYVSAGLMIIVTFLLAIQAVRERAEPSGRHGLHWPFGIFVCTADVVLLIIAIVMTAVRQTQVEKSSSAGLSTFGKMSTIKWEDETTTFDQKLLDFFSAVKDVDGKLEQENTANLICLLVLLTIMVRLICATAVHPRVGLIPSSISHGMDDLIHFVVIFISLYLLFAVLATWTMGSSQEDFVNVRTSCATQFNMMIGDLPDGWAEDTNMLIYVVANFIVFFFLLLYVYTYPQIDIHAQKHASVWAHAHTSVSVCTTRSSTHAHICSHDASSLMMPVPSSALTHIVHTCRNFLLAIIVEAYMKTRQSIEDIQYARFFFNDVWLCCYHPILGYLSGWPSGMAIRQMLAEAEDSGRTNVSASDLQQIFPNESSLERFLAAYKPLCTQEEETEVTIQSLADKIQKMQETQDQLLSLLRISTQNSRAAVASHGVGFGN